MGELGFSAGGSITVATGTDNVASYITVNNTGPLVPKSALASPFEPFTRLEGQVSHGQGVGLGLSIVTTVDNAHHGHLYVPHSPPEEWQSRFESRTTALASSLVTPSPRCR